MQKSEMFQSAVLSEEVLFITSRTIYSRIGDAAGWLSVVLTAALLVATRRKVR